MSALNTTSGKLFVMVALWSAYPSVGWAQEVRLIDLFDPGVR
jgi:hypothetical protein